MKAKRNIIILICLLLASTVYFCSPSENNNVNNDGGLDTNNQDTDITEDTNNNQDTESDIIDDSSQQDDENHRCNEDETCGPYKICCKNDEVCVDNSKCLPPCDNERCGEDSTTCCGSGEVCFNFNCVTPGTICTDSDQCSDNEICDPVLGRCMPRGNNECIYTPPVGQFSPVTEWQWNGLESMPDYHNVLMTPVVGDMDNDGIQEVVFSAYSAEGTGGVLVVLNGQTGTVEAVGISDNVKTRRSSHIAIGDINNDGSLEIIAASSNIGIFAAKIADAQIMRLWLNDDNPLNKEFNNLAPVIADLDSDGQPEIIIGLTVLDAQGNILDTKGGGGTHPGDVYNSWNPIVYDIDGDGRLEIVTGNRAYSFDSNSGLILQWENEDIGDGYTAAADLNNDGKPELITVTLGEVYVLNGQNGNIIEGPIDLPGGGQGGTPTAGDFNGDGRADFAIAGQATYSVFDMTCVQNPLPSDCEDYLIRWSVSTQDLSSSVTGSSVFDFEGDGKAEVIYNDECRLRVFSGVDGQILLDILNTSRTSGEYPIVVDVDSDEKAEIVVAANDDQVDRDQCNGGTHGIFVFGDKNDNWVRTRKIWNEHSYHITNISEDGEIPANEEQNWSQPEFNNFRMNVQGDGNPLDASDLFVSTVETGEIYCPDSLIIIANVSNKGAISVPQKVAVSLYRGLPESDSELIETQYTTRALHPGESESMVFTYNVPEADQEQPLNFYIVVDAESKNSECNEENNIYPLENIYCIGIY